MRWLASVFLVGLGITLMGCSSTPPRCTCPCHERHAAVANADLARAELLSATYRAPTGGGSSTTSKSAAGPYRPTMRTGYTGYVRLRGSQPIHLPHCPLVRKAAPGGATPAGRNDGPACFTCRKSEALAAER